MENKLEKHLKKLVFDEVLKYSTENGKKYLHLNSPCKIEISERITQKMKDEYEPKVEKGGVLVAELSKNDGKTLVEINDVIYIRNASEIPENSYMFDKNEEKITYKKTLYNKDKITFPIRFHTHPNNSESPIVQLMQYATQSNTSKQNQLASKYPIKLDDINLLMPRGLMLCSGYQNKMFIGLYNGMIAPFEFKEHREEQIQKAMDNFSEQIFEWVKQGNNKWLLVGGVITLILLSIKYNKVAIPLLMLLLFMLPTFINNNHKESNYFSQLSSGSTTILIP